jgi:hypothetical protein
MNIDYILNGNRKPKQKPLGDLFSMKPKKQVKDPLMDLFNMKPKKPMPSILGDHITKPQKRAIKQAPFSDWDRDGVINGLDCQPRNPKKHSSNWKKIVEKGKDGVIHYGNSPMDSKKNFFKNEVMLHRESYPGGPKLKDDALRESDKMQAYRELNLGKNERQEYIKQKEYETEAANRSEQEFLDRQEKMWRKRFDELEEFDNWRDQNRTFNPSEYRSNIDDDYEEYVEMKKRQQPKIYKKVQSFNDIRDD